MGRSFLRMSSRNGRGMINAVIPKTMPILAIFEPIALPTASSGSPCSEEVTATKISGAEVPRATMVKPTIVGEM